MRKGTVVAWVAVPGVAAGLAVSGAAVATAEGTAHAAASKVSLSADAGGQLKYSKSKLSAKAGKVTIAMMDPSSSGIPHGIAIQGNGVKKVGKVVSPGATSTLKVKLKKGTYTFYCPVPGHKGAGMHGKLVVK